MSTPEQIKRYLLIGKNIIYYSRILWILSYFYNIYLCLTGYMINKIMKWCWNYEITLYYEILKLYLLIQIGVNWDYGYNIIG
jgi:hypothetical protein